MALASGSLSAETFPVALCAVPLIILEAVSNLELGGAAIRLCLPRENQEDEGILEVTAEVDVMDDLRDSPGGTIFSLSVSSAGFLVVRDPYVAREAIVPAGLATLR